MPEISKEASMSEKQFTADGFRVAAKRAAKSFEDADSLSGSYRDVVLAALKIAAIATDRIVFDACKLSPDEQLSLEKRILAVGGFIGVVDPPPHLAASASSPEPETEAAHAAGKAEGEAGLKRLFDACVESESRALKLSLEVAAARAEALEEAAAALDDEAMSLDGTADECIVIKRWPETCPGVTSLREQARLLRSQATAIRALNSAPLPPREES